ncbi:unnamed protein product [Ixodes pacificus]
MMNDYALKWEQFEQEIKMKAMERASAIKYRERKLESFLRGNLELLIGEESRSSGIYKDDISTLKSKLEVLDKERYHGALVRARAGKLFCREAPTKRALGAEKRYARRNEIVEIEYRGAVTRDSAEIEKAFCEFYRNLFSHRTVDLANFKSEFLRLLPRLNSETTSFLAAEITVDEVENAIEHLNH